jgi:hypothetical protein
MFKVVKVIKCIIFDAMLPPHPNPLPQGERRQEKGNQIVLLSTIPPLAGMVDLLLI